MDHTLPSPSQDQTLLGHPVHSEPGPLAADAIPGYQIFKELQRGGQGIVYQALQKSTKRTVAIKVMKEGPFADGADKARFEREVRILAQLDHPHVVPIHDSGVVAGFHYFVMGYIEGLALNDHMSAQRSTNNITADSKLLSTSFVQQTMQLFAKICEAVSAAHARGILHRDLKTGNIRVDSQGNPHILDFGLAKTASGQYSEESQDPTVTQTGHFLGSLAWASPEQAAGQPSKIDLRSDVYSLGVILYNMLTDRFPYDVVGPVHTVLNRIIHDEPTPPGNLSRQIGGDIETIVLKCLAKDRERRYPSAAELARDIRHYLAGEPIEAKRDSFTYLLRKRSIALMQRYKISAFLAIVIAVWLSYFVGKKVVYDLTPLNGKFMELMSAHFSPARFGTELENVRVVAIKEETDLKSLALKEGRPDVDPAVWKSVRRLHGRLFEKLARSGARAVVSDIGFSSESEFDADLVKGARALREAGIPITIVVSSWWADDDGVPKLSKLVAPEVIWGSSCCGFGAGAPWRIQLLMQRGQAEPLPSLALAAYASYQHPDAQVNYVLDEANQMAHLLFWKPDPIIQRARHRLPDDESHHIRLSMVRPREGDNPQLGRKADDMIGWLVMDLPSDDVLEKSTLEYGRVFSADDAMLRQMFEGKIVLLGDLLPGKDRYMRPDGSGKLAGCYGHAVGLDTLIRRTAYLQSTTLGRRAVRTLTGIAAILGCVAALMAAGRPWRRRLVVAALTILGVLATIVSFRQFNQLYNPIVPVFALVVSSELAAIMQRVHGNPAR